VPLSPDELLARLDALGMSTTTTDHAPVFTVEESQALRGLIGGAHTKNLFLRDNKRNFFLVTVEEDRKVDLKQLRGMIGAKGGLSFASPEALAEHLGVQPGSVSPFAAVNDEAGAVRVFLDAALLQASAVNCHPLINTRTTTIAPADLVAFLASVDHAPDTLDFEVEAG
jgi:Ala-tRNA(Pro) deacylase